MKPLLPLLPLLALALLSGCADSGTPQTPKTSSTVYGPCRFCGKPGYSAVQWLDSPRAQERAEEGDPKVRGTIVCGKCRREMAE